ncbi:uncharacterized protein [Polyergus mexicanus]|uniref:uncharacterized protein n=1 Tax=Polyergus mexicanus TaxID=615972 RepID=UPI0038B49346
MPKVEKESAMAIRGLVDYTLKHLRVLKSLNLPTDSWNELVIHMIEAKLDAATLRTWEQSVIAVDVTLVSLTDFLEKRCQILERIETRVKDKEIRRKTESDKKRAKSHSHEKPITLANSIESGKCYLCQGNHFMYCCDKFLALAIDDRFKEVSRLKLCTNCLRNDHFVKACKIRSCRECSGRHNTLCHRPTADKHVPGGASISVQKVPSSSDEASNNVVVHHAVNEPTRRHVFMATAVVNAIHSNGSIVPLCILLDSASEAHFITHSAYNRLGVRRNRASEIVTGLSGIENNVSQCCKVAVQSRHSSVCATIRTLIVPKITKRLSAIELDYDTFKIPLNIKLADPEFYKRGSIDMLIGAEFFFDWLELGRIERGDNLPILQSIKLGWIIAGSVARIADTSLLCNCTTLATLTCSLEHCETLNQTLSKFWEIENSKINAIQPRLKEAIESDEFCEKTTTRNDNNRFVVRLPFLDDPKLLGESRETARKRLMQLERRFNRDKTLHER